MLRFESEIGSGGSYPSMYILSYFLLFFCVCSSANNFLCMSFFVYFVVGWLKFGGKERKEEPLLLAQWNSFFGLLAIDKEGAQSVEKFFSGSMMVFFLGRDLGKIEIL